MQEIIDEVFFAHLVNLREHRLALRVSGLEHDNGDAAAVGPVRLLSQENLAQLREGEVLDRIRAIDDDRE